MLALICCIIIFLRTLICIHADLSRQREEMCCVYIVIFIDHLNLYDIILGFYIYSIFVIKFKYNLFFIHFFVSMSHLGSEDSGSALKHPQLRLYAI